MPDHIADGPNTTEADAITDRDKFGSDRLYIVDPAVRVFDPVTTAYIERPASGYVAGILSRMDATRGFCSLAERRSAELAQDGEARTPWLRAGDALQVQARLASGSQSLFGAIELQLD